MNEPLKDKRKTMIGVKPLPKIDFFFADAVKSAVQGLLKDLQRAINNTVDENKKFHLEYALYLVKKWFPDVM